MKFNTKMNEREAIITDLILNYEDNMIRKATKIVNDEALCREAFEDGIMEGYENFNGTGNLKAYLIQCAEWKLGNVIQSYYGKKRAEFRSNCFSLTDEVVTCIGVMDTAIEDASFEDFYNGFCNTLNPTQKSLLDFLFKDEFAINEWCKKRGCSKPFGSKIRKQLQDKYIEYTKGL